MKSSILLAGLLAFVVAGWAVRGQPTDGLVAYYPFRGHARDLGPNGLHGTVHGATLATDRAGRAGMAYSFNGSSDYIDLGNSALLRPTNHLTLSMWACADWTNITTPCTLVGNTQKAGGYAVQIVIYTTPIYYRAIQALVRRTVNPSSPSYGLTGLTPGWHHFAFASDSRATYWYIDGELIVAIMGSGPVGYAYENNFLIGAHSGTGDLPDGGYFAGSIDELRIYDRALSRSEIVLLSELPDIPPDIAIEPAVIYSWETVPGNYRVEWAPAAEGPWTVVPGTVVWLGGRSRIAVPAGSTQPYSRLVRIE